MANDQIDRAFDCIEENEAAIAEGLSKDITAAFFAEGPSAQSQAQAIAMLRRLAENGILYAHLMGRTLIPVGVQEDTKPAAQPQRRGLFTTPAQVTGAWKTIGDLLQAAMSDMQLATIDGDKGAMERRKGRAEPTEVLQALIG